MSKPFPVARVALVGAALSLAACVDSTAPAKPRAERPAATPTFAVALQCAASLTTRSVTCAPPSTPVAAGSQAIIVGGQDTYLKLVSSNVQVFADTFAFDVTVKNLVRQALGTTNPDTSAVAPDANGVRVFFASGPTSTGAGSIAVANATGVGTFTGSNQPYFQYAGDLRHLETSPAQTWKLRFSPEVANFTFTVYVSAAVAYPAGYVDGQAHVLTLDPGESFTLPGTARSAVGTALPDAVTFTSGNPSVAAVNGAVITAGNTNGATTIAADAGGRPGFGPSYAAVCPSTVVANGSQVAASIDTSDCYAVLHPSDGYAPGTSYYGDLYRVSLTAGQSITITLDNGSSDGLSGLDTYLVFADRLGNVLAQNDDDLTGALGYGSRLTYTAAATGTYVIQASTFSVGSDPNGRGTYTIRVAIQ